MFDIQIIKKISQDHRKLGGITFGMTRTENFQHTLFLSGKMGQAGSKDFLFSDGPSCTDTDDK